MTQNGLKWILNTTLKSMKFCRPGPPPRYEKFHTFFFLMKASLTLFPVAPSEPRSSRCQEAAGAEADHHPWRRLSARGRGSLSFHQWLTLIVPQ